MTEAMALSLMAMTNERAERRHHADQRLRQDDGADRLQTAHAERQSRLHLIASDRGEPRPDGLRDIGAEMDAEADDPGRHRVERAPDHQRKGKKVHTSTTSNGIDRMVST